MKIFLIALIACSISTHNILIHQEVKGDQCVDLLHKLLEQGQKVQDDFKNQDIQSLVVDLQQFAGLFVADYKCYANKINLDFKNLFYKMIFSGDQRQCIIDHLHDFVGELKEALKHLFEKDVDGAEFHLKKAVEILQDIQNC